MALTFDAAKMLFRAGRYVELMEHSGLDATALGMLTPEHRVLLAQAAFHAGNRDAALRISKRENSPDAPAGLRSRCEVILGLVQRTEANWDSALRHFQLSIQLAKEARNVNQVGWTSVWLFRAMAEIQPTDALAAMVNDMRRYVTLAGDPHLAAYMHDSIALMEASAGRLQEARRHLRISVSLVERNPNAWLQQVSLVSSFFLDFLDCRYLDAIRSLNAARELIAVTGGGQAPIIDCNEGHALIVAGRFALAEQRLRKIADTAAPQFALGSLDGLARLYLATGRLSDCEDVLKRCDSLAAELTAVDSAFAGRWTAVTRLKLLLQRGLFLQAAEDAERYLQHATRLDDRMLLGTLTWLRAHALGESGSASEAARILAPLGATDAVSVPGQQGGYYRAAGVILRHSRHTVSRAMLERALAIWQDQGNQHEPLELGHVATPVAARVDLAKDDESGIKVANALAAAINVAHSKELLARELLGAIRELQCSPDADVIEVRANASAGDFADRLSLPLGEYRGKRLALVCRIPDDPSRALALSDILRVGRAALALERGREEERNRAALWPASPVEEQAGALFVSDEMQALVATARRIAPTNVPVLITGETGTGKEVLARTIHGYSNRAKAVFLPFNCTSTPKDMLDSQLFGHRRGSFTGATDNFQGIIRAAHGGTLFLDEIGDMGLEVQPKLLRFLESGEVHPVGDTHPVRVDVRVIAATNVNLDTLVSERRFREDLFYRLNIVRLHLPPLRERRVEIPALAHHYLQKHAHEYGKGDLRLAEETMEYLVLYRWPGNVRQLANEMRRLAALCESGAVLMPEHLAQEIAASRRTIPASERVLDATEVVVRLDQPLAAATEHIERALLQYALKKCGGHMEETASLLGLSRKGLYLKRQRFGIEPPPEARAAVDAAHAPSSRGERVTSGS